jgi:hypothetical protein
MLTNYDLLRIAKKLGIPLVDILNKDVLPSSPVEGGYIFNLQDDKDDQGNDNFGTHWVALYIEGNKAAYFDSFGFPPPVQVHHFIKKFRPYAVSEKHIQNVRSGVCGWFVIYFLWFMVNHKHIPFNQRFQKFIGLWSDDPTKNKTLLEKYMKPL